MQEAKTTKKKLEWRAFFVYFVLLGLIVLFALGNHVKAMGGNKIAASYSGVRVDRNTILVFMYAGLIMAARLKSGRPEVGAGMELDAVAALHELMSRQTVFCMQHSMNREQKGCSISILDRKKETYVSGKRFSGLSGVCPGKRYRVHACKHAGRADGSRFSLRWKKYESVLCRAVV